MDWLRRKPRSRTRYWQERGILGIPERGEFYPRKSGNAAGIGSLIFILRGILFFVLEAVFLGLWLGLGKCGRKDSDRAALENEGFVSLKSQNCGCPKIIF